MRLKNNKKYLIASASLIGLFAIGAITWALIGDDTKSVETTQKELDSGDSNSSSDNTKDEQDSDKNQSERINDDEEGPVEDSTVAITDVEFQPIPEGENPEEVPTLPVLTNHYKIDQLGDDFFEVELYAILNKPEQYSEYRAQLIEFKQEALNYLVENDFDIQSSRISYIPAEAAEL